MTARDLLAQARAERIRLQAMMWQLGERIGHLDQIIGVCEAILQHAAQPEAAPSSAAPTPETPAPEGDGSPDAPRSEGG